MRFSFWTRRKYFTSVVAQLLSRRKRRVGIPKYSRLRLESLEDRLAPALVQWTGAGSDLLWSDANNWSGNQMPGSSDDAVIGTAFAGQTITSSDAVSINSVTSAASLSITGGTFTIAGASTANNSTGVSTLSSSLLFSGGTLTGAGMLTVDALLTWTGGTMSGTGSTVADGGLAITVPSTNALNLINRTLSNAAAATLSGSFFLEVGNNAVIDNLGSGTFDVQDAAGIRTGVFISGPATFLNQGILTKSTGAGTTTIINTGLNNDGTLSVLAGTLDLNGGGTDTGPDTFSVAAAATLGFDGGTHNLDASSSVSGAGTIEFGGNGTTNFAAGATYNVSGITTVDGGTANFSGAATTATLTQSAGTLTGTGTVTVSGQTTWTGGTMSGTGSTVADGGLAITVPSTNALNLTNRTLSNAAAATLSGSFFLEVGNNAVIDNLGSGTFDVQDAAGIRTGVFISGPATFLNQGILTKSTGAGTTTIINTGLNNDGTLSVLAGTLDLNGGGTDTGPDSFSVAAAATLGFDGGTHNLDASSSVSGAGTIEFGGNGTTNFAAGATYNVSGITTVDGGTANFSGAATTATLTQSSGTLTGTGTVTVSGQTTWTGGRCRARGRRWPTAAWPSPCLGRMRCS